MIWVVAAFFAIVVIALAFVALDAFWGDDYDDFDDYGW